MAFLCRRFPLFATAHILIFLSGTTWGEASPALFDYENIRLRSSIRPIINRSEYKECRVSPGDEDWPDDASWNELNNTMNGALLKPIPVASVCYNSTSYNNFEAGNCEAVTSNWSTTAKHPIEVNSPIFEGLTCIPPASLNTNGCTQGGFPVYVVNASNVAHIQAAVNFAREKQIRLVIKNTGHDMSGKSLGGGALSIWTHHLKNIAFYPNYTTDGYSGPAFKAGAGVQAKEIYDAAFDRGLMVVGGVCDSVGLFGGYSQGGGHSMLGSLHGMGADQVLSIQVVTADGNFITASPTENTDLFWALRGGGAGTFGVVTSMTVKAFKDIEMTVGTLEWSVKGNNISIDTFWQGVSSFFSYFDNFTEQGSSAQWNIFPNGSLSFSEGSPLLANPRFQIMPFMTPGKPLEEAKKITAPWLAEMNVLGINITMDWNHFPSYHTAYYSVFSSTDVAIMPYSMSYASRLVPRENFNKSQKLNETVAAYRKISEAGHFFNAYMYAPTLKAGAPVGPDGNAIHPAWRNGLSHTIIFQQWNQTIAPDQQMKIRQDFATDVMKQLRDITPGAGSYGNEGDVLEPDFQHSFYGDYEKLLKIKGKYDPDDVFWAVTAVGSEGWAVRSVDGLPTQNGPLCRVST
ncbi:hypothetical protein EG329_008786 [Mollisiaceae sp. DMI_Dod_QoI]|nr:hypothetical protein EG329_008786 [Helotiales sp. DMI_Dod_QoI]